MNSRRLFLKNGIALTVAMAAGACAKSVPGAVQAKPEHRYMIIIDQNRCMGCQACVIACKAEHDAAENEFNTKIVKEEHSSKQAVFYPIQCNHCEDPLCVKACSINATFKLANGIVVTDWQKCDGLGDCVSACPYDARFFDTRFKGGSGPKVDKCDMCISRIEKGLVPSCVEVCPAGTKIFGDAENPSGEFAEYLKNGRLLSAKPELRIKTIVKYRMKKD